MTDISESFGAVPMAIPKTVRPEEIRAITSLRAGKIACHAFIPVLREDKVSRGSVSLHFRMEETVRPLLNSVGVKGTAVFVPYSAFERFDGSMDKLNKSYQGIKDRDADAAPIPFVKSINFAKAAPFWKTLGVHWPDGAAINDAPVEAYNLYVNWQRAKMSSSLSERLLNDTTLAQAFWQHPFMWHIKKDFSQAMMDGEVALSWSDPMAPVKGLGLNATGVGSAITQVRETSSGATVSYSRGIAASVAANGMAMKLSAGGYPLVFADLAASGPKISLANIELGKQIVAWAKSREQYKGIDAEHLKDLLMEGIRVPDEALKEPIILATARGVVNYTERHAMDGDSLDKSVTTGETSVTLNFWTPQLNSGGVILILSEIVPEQMFERTRDEFLGITAPTQFPNAKNDFLDPEKVSVVKNKFVDVFHGTPEGIFGYAPLNHEWKRSHFRAGGKFYRPVPDVFVEDRQRFWSVETPNPALNSTFYLVPEDLPHSVFADTLADAFEVSAVGAVTLIGNTQFGKAFEEDDGSYEAVADGVDMTRIVQP